MRGILFAIIFAIFFQSYSQKLENGVYPTVSSFILNKPIDGISINEIATPKAKKSLKANSIETNPEFNLNSSRIFGLTDGINFYINSNEYDPGNLVRYTRLLYCGFRLGYFYKTTERYGAGYTIIDFKTGHTYPMNKNSITKMLNDRPELKEDFLKEKKGIETYAKYLKLYDQTMFQQFR
ncbi:hypothetical protein [Ekhidna sp.]|uniref:hypothetical protein n=1 Tax=Ekhidna sp. TaxID=2608089 RepID=UPI0032EBF9F0